MNRIEIPKSVFPTAEDDAGVAKRVADSPQTRSASYRLAYTDDDFLLRDDLRPVRLQLELLKPELLQQEHGINSTVVIFGSSHIADAKTAKEKIIRAEAQLELDPADPVLHRKLERAKRIQSRTHYYDEARKLARIITAESQKDTNCELVVITGGGPGIMEAANRGAHDAGGKSIGLNIVLPFEQHPNAYITPELCFQFHYFALRKMHFLKRAKALVACPGGFGTMDELFETLTLIQTRKIKPVPVILLGSDYWHRIINFSALVEEGTVDDQDLTLMQFVDTAEEAWQIIKSYYDSHN